MNGLRTFAASMTALLALVTGADAQNCRKTILLEEGRGTREISFDYKEKHLDLSAYEHMAFSFSNDSDAEIVMDILYYGPERNNTGYGRDLIAPGEKGSAGFILNRPSLPEDSPWMKDFPLVRGLPDGYVRHWNAFDLRHISKVTVRISWKDSKGGSFTISEPIGKDSYVFNDLDPESLPMPLIDRMGRPKYPATRYAPADDEELAKEGEQDRSLEAGFDPALFSRFGGMKALPRQKATGMFRTAKYDGKWTLVDPEGYLFWSIGIDCAGKGVGTDCKDKEYLFEIPDAYSEEEFAEDRKRNSINYYELNLRQKYGEDWKDIHRQVTVNRLRSWGLNTVGAWSDLHEGMEHPYTIIIHTQGIRLGKMKKQIPDPFSERFQESLNRGMENIQKFRNDPWNVGVFVDNELGWGSSDEIARSLLVSSRSIAARRAMENWLEKKYGRISSLNSAWKTSFVNFQSVSAPEKATEAFREDMKGFTGAFAEEYFSRVSRAMKEYMPGHLYLGCRFHEQVRYNGIVQGVASHYCDVLSYNIYEYSINGFEVLSEIDKPALIGEFHFGTATDGVWGTGLRNAYNVENQAELYRQYMEDAASHPQFVGAHWFQWADQPATGRNKDGENFRIGFVNVADHPYERLTEESRRISLKIPEIRFGEASCRTIMDFQRDQDIPFTASEGVKATYTEKGLEMTVEPGKTGKVTFKGKWDLTDWIYLTCVMTNEGDSTVRVNPVLKGGFKDKSYNGRIEENAWILPGERRAFNCMLLPDYSTRKSNYGEIEKHFPGTRGFPEAVSFARTYDLSLTREIEFVFPEKKDCRQTLILSSIEGRRPSVAPLFRKDKEKYFPFIDRYGQYIHGDWEGKIHDDGDFARQKAEEDAYLAGLKQPEVWDRFGGYAAGPQYKATGHFRVEKINGNWWFINPDGHLFWSVGVNSAGKLNVETPVKGRENFFEVLSDSSNINFGKVLMEKKYGNDGEAYARRCFERLKKWGFNTLGGWSETRIQNWDEAHKLPYTISTSTVNVKLTDKFPDVFAPQWKANVDRIYGRYSSVDKDPYCIGFFSDNELYWYGPDELAAFALDKTAGSYAKQTYVGMLKKSFRKISVFNEKTGKDFSSWDELLQTKVRMDLKALNEVNTRFYEKTAETYFSTISQAIRKYAPHKLYIGCRWHVSKNHRNDINVAVGARYLDIISHNQYVNELTPETFPQMEGIDKPYMITEFNFGALDSGKFYPGLGHASDQRNRGEKYVNYVKSALKDPRCVGTHWFMWGDSTTAGRSNVGENANCGLVSQMDTPYYLMLEYMKWMNGRIYNDRKF